MSMANARDREQQPEIPTFLIYEEMDGKAIPYRGYQQVLDGKEKLEGIMGYGDLQLLVLNIMADYFKSVFGRHFWVLAGEGGLHLAKHKNLSTDIAFYPRAALSLKETSNQYLGIPPKVVIEIDTKADPEFLQQMDYYSRKTQNLLDFGVEQVIWLFTDTQKVLNARPGQVWTISNWNEPLELMGHPFIITDILNAAES